MYSDNGTNFVGANKLLISAQQFDRDHATCPTWHSAILPQYRRPLGGRCQARQGSPKKDIRQSQANL